MSFQEFAGLVCCRPPSIEKVAVWQGTETSKGKMAAGPFQSDKHLFDILPSRRQFCRAHWVTLGDAWQRVNGSAGEASLTLSYTVGVDGRGRWWPFWGAKCSACPALAGELAGASPRGALPTLGGGLFQLKGAHSLCPQDPAFLPGMQVTKRAGGVSGYEGSPGQDGEE
ncbi:hypothetical protein NQZ68_013320 [Dissostichus eleginoides]|nr:hypothetical protein NQZ68_013320 [Dissostichus eleginoides]